MEQREVGTKVTILELFVTASLLDQLRDVSQLPTLFLYPLFSLTLQLLPSRGKVGLPSP